MLEQTAIVFLVVLLVSILVAVIVASSDDKGGK